MKQNNRKEIFARLATSMANTMLKSTANSRCVFVYHQPKQPIELKKIKKYNHD